ncbi:MAG: ABC transporter substrate-binding protein/permease [Clostridia bacterium]|nr:ABC transporter substrate-binding protein/permease [Clostridia bacterium]
MTRKKAVQRAEAILISLGILTIVLVLLLGGQQTSDSQKPPIHDFADLSNGSFAVVLGSSYDIFVERYFPNATMNIVTTWDEECLQVMQGKSDAVLWESSSLDEALEVYPKLMALEDPLDSLDFMWCTRKDSTGETLRDELNAFIRPMRESGELDELFDLWENTESAPDHVEFSPMDVPSKGELHVGTCLDWQPICYENNGNPCGYMIDLLYRFCSSCGYTPVFDYVDTQTLLPGLYTGKYDLLCYGFEYREEATESVYYTDTVMSDDVYVLILKDRYAGFEAQEAAPKMGIAERFSRGLAGIRASLEKNFIRENRWMMILRGLRTTVLLSLGSVIFGTVLGGLICLMYRSRYPFLEAFARIYIRIIQGTPIVLLLMILYYVVFGNSPIPAFWVCILGFTLDFSAYASEIFRSGIGAVPDGQRKAAIALGFSRFESFTRVVFPQMVIHCLPVYIGQIVSTIKLTSVAGYISVQDLTRISDLIRARTYDAFFPLVFTALVYFFIAWLMMLCLHLLEKQIDPMKRKRTVRGVKPRADQG